MRKTPFSRPKAIPGQDIYQALRNGTIIPQDRRYPSMAKSLRLICDKLVKVDSSYTMCLDDPEMVILKRKERIRFEQPVETYGFGFFNNFPKFWKMKFQG